MMVNPYGVQAVDKTAFFEESLKIMIYIRKNSS